MDVYVIRHGETDWNKADRCQGQTDIPLNAYGRELAEITSEALKEVPFEAVFSSPLIRARVTADILRGSRDIPILVDDRMKEVSFGIKEGESITRMKTNPQEPLYYLLNQPDKYVPPQGAESLAELYARSADFVRDRLLPLEGKYGTVLLVAHGAWNRSLINPAAGIAVKDFWQIRLPNCAVSRLEMKKGELHLIEASHLYYTLKE